MVKRLSAAGFDILIHDIDPARTLALVDLPGVAQAKTLREFGGVELAICMLPSSAEVEGVVAGATGLFWSLPKGSLIVDMGSSEPQRTVALAAMARERELDLVDAPVSGGVVKARTGELTIMFGGEAELLARCLPVLERLGVTIVHVGDVGCGHAMKALNNLLSATGLVAAAEVIEIGRRFGLDPRVMLQVINSSTGRNHATETKIAQFVLSGTFASGFALRLMAKDVSTAVDLGRDEDVAMPIAEACKAIWGQAAEALPADADHTQIASLLGAAARTGGS